MRFDILTLFPAMVQAALSEGILRIAAEKCLAEYHVTNFRDFATGVHQSVDDRPFGGGPGMVLKCEPLFKAVRDVIARSSIKPHLVLLTPQGRPFKQAVARELATKERILMLCGRYEGFDERIRQGFAWDEISIGDFVLSGGELAALCAVDATVRLLPGVLGDEGSTHEESFGEAFEGKRLEYPQYTRPPEFEGMKVPDVLISGHHAEIAKWRKQQTLERTKQRRPDLLDSEPRA
jgi:tRNA (guanine37-N1)-methyltransferase